MDAAIMLARGRASAGQAPEGSPREEQLRAVYRNFNSPPEGLQVEVPGLWMVSQLEYSNYSTYVHIW